MSQNVALLEKTLNSQQIQAASLLALGRQVRSVASDVGISERQLHRWRSIPEFQCLEDIYKSRLQGQIGNKIKDLVDTATKTVEDLLCNAESERTRLKAAEIVLKMAVSLPEDALEKDVRIFESMDRYGFISRRPSWSTNPPVTGDEPASFAEEFAEMMDSSITVDELIKNNNFLSLRYIAAFFNSDPDDVPEDFREKIDLAMSAYQHVEPTEIDGEYGYRQLSYDEVYPEPDPESDPQTIN